MRIRVIETLDEVSPEQWNALQPAGSPFMRHEFLRLLEHTGCANKKSGWAARHLLVQGADGTLLGAAALYLKPHSWGEFVFDWSWASAYGRAGLSYYPKLVCAVPFTPASGTRLLVKAGVDAGAVRGALVQAMLNLAREQGASSVHILFPADDELEACVQAGFAARKDCQFHWFNRGYRSFDEFLGTFRADKRKKAKRERRRIEEAGVHFVTLNGTQMTVALWDIVYQFSAANFARHGHDHYLSAEFFKAIAAALPDNIMVKLAVAGSTPVAAAIFFESDDTLYGRYWGAGAEFHSLHFETCYYQGIDYCIAKGLKRFEPGTQGEHKVPRGFEPSFTHSAHWIGDPRFDRAIRDFLRREAHGVDEYAQSVRDHVPFRRDLATHEDAALWDPSSG